MCDTVSPNATLVDPFPFLEEETGLLRSAAVGRLTCTLCWEQEAVEVLHPAVESCRFPAESPGSSLHSPFLQRCPARLVRGGVSGQGGGGAHRRQQCPSVAAGSLIAE